MTESKRSRTNRSGRVGRILWPVGWVLLLVVSLIVAYLLFVIVGR